MGCGLAHLSSSPSTSRHPQPPHTCPPYVSPIPKHTTLSLTLGLRAKIEWQEDSLVKWWQKTAPKMAAGCLPFSFKLCEEKTKVGWNWNTSLWQRGGVGSGGEWAVA